MKKNKFFIILFMVGFSFQCSSGNQDAIIKFLISDSFLKDDDSKKEDEKAEYSVDFSRINEDLHGILAYKSGSDVSSSVQLNLSDEAKKEGWKQIPSSKKVKLSKESKIRLSLGGVVFLGEKKIAGNQDLTLVSVMGDASKVKNFKYLALSLSDKKTGKLSIDPSDLEKLKGKSLDFSKSYAEFKKETVVKQALNGKVEATDQQVNSLKTEEESGKSEESKEEGNNDIQISIKEIPQTNTPSIVQSRSNLVHFKGKFLALKQTRVYSSDDAKDWKQETTTNYPTADDSSVVLFKNKLWIVAPYRLKDRTLVIRNEVFNSNDGLNWNQVRNDGDVGGFTVRNEQATVVFKNKLWILGGRLGFGAAKDVWSSSDGITWTKETDNPGWNPRWDLRVVVFKDKLWIVGGKTYTNAKPDGFSSSTVWSSADGKNWEKIGDLPEGLEGHEVVSFKDKLWTIGGVSNGVSKKGEILVSYNGKDWKRVGSLNISGPISREVAHQGTEKGFYFTSNTTVFNDSIYFVNFEKAWKISVVE